MSELTEDLVNSRKIDINPAEARLFELRHKLGTWAAVAARLGVSTSYISDITGGRRDISANLAKKLGFNKIVEYIKI